MAFLSIPLIKFLMALKAHTFHSLSNIPLLSAAPGLFGGEYYSTAY
jgi:hypothetical protein